MYGRLQRRVDDILRNRFPVSVSALRFCSSVIEYAWKEQAKQVLPPSQRFTVGPQDVAAVLLQDELENAQLTCQEVMAGALQGGQPWAVDAAKTSQTDGVLHPLGRLQAVDNEDRSPAWKASLEHVCKDECQELVAGIWDARVPIIGSLESKAPTETCANEVVRKVEAHILGCCAETCGWNGAACTFWPFFSVAEKGAWEAECCTEWNVLAGSDREKLCDATLTPSQKVLADEHDLEKSEKGAVLLGQDEQLKWTRNGARNFHSEHVQEGQVVSQEFLLKDRTPSISIQDGLDEGWWIREVLTSSSLLELGDRTSDCPPPFDTIRANEKKADSWFKIGFAHYGPHKAMCGNPQLGNQTDEVTDCTAFIQPSVSVKAKCFSVKETCKIFEKELDKNLKRVKANPESTRNMVYFHKSLCTTCA